MASDFSAKQIRVSQIIASGGIAGAPGTGLAIYSASDASNLTGGVTPSAVLSGFSSDVFLFVSGTKDGVNRGTGVTLFGGDVVVSGTLYAEKQIIEVDESVTGSLDIQGSLFVSSSATVAGGITINQDAGPTIGDGVVVKGTATGKELLRIDPSTNRVLILSGGGDKSFNQSIASNVSFFVSGAQAFDYGEDVALFGGDVYLSGGLVVESAIVTIAETLDHMGDPDTFLKFDSDKITLHAGGKDMVQLVENSSTGNHVLFLSGGSDKSVNESSGVDVGFYVSGSIGERGKAGKGIALLGGDLHVSGVITSDNTEFSQWTDEGSFLRPSDSSGVEHVVIGSNSINGAAILLASDGGAVFNQQAGSVDFRVESKNKPNALFVSGNLDQVLIMSGGAATSTNESAGNDVVFYVSGSTSSHGTTTRGTSLFGGDAVVSGGLYLGGRIYNEGDDDTYIRPRTDEWEFYAGGTQLLTLNKNENTVSINPDNGSISTVIQGANKQGIAVDGSLDRVLILSGGAATSFNEATVSDVSFYVSGAVNSKGTSVRGASLFGGDLVVSGALALNQGAADGNQVFVTTLGRVGIGTSSPDYKLDVAGSIGINEYIYHNGDSHTNIQLDADAIRISAGGTELINANKSENTISFNSNQAAINTVIHTDTKLAFAAGTPLGAAKDQVLIMSGGGDKSFDEAKANDVLFYISGSRTQIGGAGANTTGRHTGQRTNTVFGGDVVFSGSIYGGGDISPGTPSLHLGADILQLSARNQIAMSNDAGLAPGFGSANATDTFFSVSGSIDGIGHATHKGVAVFGGDVVISGSLRARQLQMTTHKLVFGDTTARFARFDSNGGDTGAGANNKMVTPYSGRLIKVVLRGTAVSNNTTVGFHRNTDGNLNLDGTSTEDITVSMGSANTAYTFNFTSAADWGPGDVVGLKINPTADPGVVIATAVWEFDSID
jgi:putative NIF3 family GTP cyclohydrolase 1 type 2